MKFVIQRVAASTVKVAGNVVGQIEKGLLVFIGVSNEDTEEVAKKMI